MIFLKKINNRIFLLSVLLVLFVISGLNTANAQSTEEVDNSLNGQHETLMRISTTYQDYKVIKHVRFNEFWKNIQDTLQTARIEQKKLINEIADLKEELLNTQIKFGEISAKLDASNSVRDRIDFLGIPLTKSVYNGLVWSIIFVLGALAILFFFRFNKSNSVTRSTKKECDTLFNEFDNYKKNTRDKELQLKRELQTAINTIEDLKL